VNASGTNRTRFKRVPFRILRYPIPNDLLTAEPRIVDFQTDFLFIPLRGAVQSAIIVHGDKL